MQERPTIGRSTNVITSPHRSSRWIPHPAAGTAVHVVDAPRVRRHGGCRRGSGRCPLSMITSSGSNTSATALIVSWVIEPAGTITQAVRGFSSLAASSASDLEPVIPSAFTASGLTSYRRSGDRRPSAGGRCPPHTASSDLRAVAIGIARNEGWGRTVAGSNPVSPTEMLARTGRRLKRTGAVRTAAPVGRSGTWDQLRRGVSFTWSCERTAHGPHTVKPLDRTRAACSVRDRGTSKSPSGRLLLDLPVPGRERSVHSLTPAFGADGPDPICTSIGERPARRCKRGREARLPVKWPPAAKFVTVPRS